MAQLALQQKRRRSSQGAVRVVRCSFKAAAYSRSRCCSSSFLGVAAIVYARQTIPGAGDGAPVTPISEYYDVAYGINICGDWATINDGDAALNADGRIDYPAYRDTGVYQYANGVATVHPYAAELADVPLDLFGIAFAVHDITIADDSLDIPEDQMDGDVYTEGETTCNIDGVETDADVSVVVWESPDDGSSGNRYISKMGEIPRF